MAGVGHLVEIHKAIGWPHGPRGYFASCSCGWRGHILQTLAAAEKDGHEHQASS